MVGLFCHMKDPDWPLLLLPLLVWGQLWPASSFFSSASDKKGWSLCSDPNSGIRSGLSVHPCLFVFPFYFCETFFPRPSLFTSILGCLKMIVEVETLSMDETTNLSTNGSGTGGTCLYSCMDASCLPPCKSWQWQVASQSVPFSCYAFLIISGYDYYYSIPNERISSHVFTSSGRSGQEM